MILAWMRHFLPTADAAGKHDLIGDILKPSAAWSFPGIVKSQLESSTKRNSHNASSTERGR